MPFTQQRDVIRSRQDLHREPKAAFVSVECSQVGATDINTYLNNYPQVEKVSLWHFDPKEIEKLNLSLLKEWVLQCPSDQTLNRLSSLDWADAKGLAIQACKGALPEAFLAALPASLESLEFRYSAPLPDKSFADFLKRSSDLSKLTLDHTTFCSRFLDESLVCGLSEHLLELNLAGSQTRVLAGLGELYTLPNLRSLDLDGCELHLQTFSQLQGANCPSLETLLAPACRGLDIKVSEPLLFPELKVLDLGLSHVRINPGSHIWNCHSLPKLEELILTRNLIQDEDAPVLAEFFETSSLRKVDLSQCCAFRGERYFDLLSALPDSLEEFRIGGIHGPEPHIARGLASKARPQLRKLDLGETELNPELLSQLFSLELPSLKDLVIPIDGDEELEIVMRWKQAQTLESLLLYNSSDHSSENLYALFEDWNHVSVW